MRAGLKFSRPVPPGGHNLSSKAEPAARQGHVLLTLGCACAAQATDAHAAQLFNCRFPARLGRVRGIERSRVPVENGHLFLPRSHSIERLQGDPGHGAGVELYELHRVTAGPQPLLY